MFGLRFRVERSCIDCYVVQTVVSDELAMEAPPYYIAVVSVFLPYLLVHWQAVVCPVHLKLNML